MSVLSELPLLAAGAQKKFSRRFGHPARWLVAAPGRLNLIGENTDYNGDRQLPALVDMGAVLATGFLLHQSQRSGPHRQQDSR
jgi:galactokinase